MDEDFTTDEEGYGCYKGYRIGMIEKLPEIEDLPRSPNGYHALFYLKINELIGKVNALEEAVKRREGVTDLDELGVCEKVGERLTKFHEKHFDLDI